MDFYMKSPVVSGFEYRPRSCMSTLVWLKTARNKTIAECARICRRTRDCRGFEYGVDYGESSHPEVGIGACRLVDDPGSHRCHYRNYDFYSRLEGGAHAPSLYLAVLCALTFLRLL